MRKANAARLMSMTCETDGAMYPVFLGYRNTWRLASTSIIGCRVCETVKKNVRPKKMEIGRAGRAFW